MQLPKDGVEFARITLTPAPPDGATVQASLDRAAWLDVDVTDGVAEFLVRGPDNTSGLGTPITADRTPVWVRVNDNPEQVIRKAGTISLL
jgi:hypothetical protein